MSKFKAGDIVDDRLLDRSKPKRGRPTEIKRDITKTSQSGLREGLTRATFIIREDTLDRLKDRAYTDRKKLKDLVTEALDYYLDNTNMRGNGMSKFKVGDIVDDRLLDRSKTLPNKPLDSSKYDTGDLFVVLRRTSEIFKHGQVVALDDDDGTPCPRYFNGAALSYFHNDDLQPLHTITNSKEKKPMGRRTFKQLKDTPKIRKGALWQEQCEDGTQPYEMITPEYDRSENKQTLVEPTRSIVEEQPSWFVEVFKVEPEYMTREQLEAFEAFLGQKKRGRPVGSKTKKAAPTTKAKMAASWTPERRKAQARRMRKMHKQGKFGVK